MKEKILKKLKEIEEKENIKIILAVESGSRAWGFSSIDSDYDVRFIYIRNKDDYLRLDEIRDVIEWQLDDVYDINGWDLKKALKLLYQSNPTLFEWSSSPIIYKKTKEWELVEEILNYYFQPQKCLYHYLSTAKKTYKDMKETVKLKKYFYVLRALFCAQYIIKYLSPPPVLFHDLNYDGLDDLVHLLLEEKRKSNETKMITRIKVLDNYIEYQLDQLSQVQLTTQKNTYYQLNNVFLSILDSK